MVILISPNSFKNSLMADEVAEAIEIGLKQSGLKSKFIKFPIGDGGDYTSHLICKHLKGEMKSMQVEGAYLGKTQANYALIHRGKTAVIEVAETSGYKSINNKVKNPLDSSTKGLGQVIRSQIESGIKNFIICLGGSATVDGGIGMLQALGLEFKDKSDQIIQAMPGNFDEVEKIECSNFDDLVKGCKFTVLCDVDNKLLGKKGAAKVFGPQKGAKPADVEQLESFLSKFDKLSKKVLGKSMNNIQGGGAAGGLGAAFAVYLKADLRHGASYFCELTKFDQELSKADLLITAEGSIDQQSLDGKAPITVAEKAKKLHIPCIGLAGRIPLEIPPKLQEYFSLLLPIANQPESLEESMKHSKANLIRTAGQIGKFMSSQKQ
ncbi:glycerate kinase [Sphingobacterium cellulitidis]|uniref:glycerate kinase family protein n=1 Tax=Sphingobacterium cellulitidis TaxID=1768011 RepID=UPI000B93AF75|nr:hypothetical protein CHT99_19420 [Sphingobacterium cellulitidis]